MIVTLQTERIRTIEQVAAFVEANEPVDFQPLDRDGAYAFVAQTLTRLGYRALDRPSKALLKRYLAKTTGYWRTQLTRLIRQYREHHVFGDARFERLAGISASHIYNLRGSRTYRRRRTAVEGTRATTVAVGERRAPQPDGLPGLFLADLKCGFNIGSGDSGAVGWANLWNVLSRPWRSARLGSSRGRDKTPEGAWSPQAREPGPREGGRPTKEPDTETSATRRQDHDEPVAPPQRRPNLVVPLLRPGAQEPRRANMDAIHGRDDARPPGQITTE